MVSSTKKLLIATLHSRPGPRRGSTLAIRVFIGFSLAPRSVWIWNSALQIGGPACLVPIGSVKERGHGVAFIGRDSQGEGTAGQLEGRGPAHRARAAAVL